MKNFYRYLPLSDEMRQQNMYVLASGSTLVMPHTPYPAPLHPRDHYFQWKQGRTLQEYQLIYITRGRGVFESRTGGICRVKAGTLFMLFPDEWHRYSPDPETGWDEYWVAFQGKIIEPLVAEYPLSRRNPILFATVNEMVREQFIQIAEEIHQEAVGYQKIIAARTLVILATATASALRQHYEGTDILDVIERAKSHLSGHISQNVNMEEMAADLGVGYSRFRRAFCHYTGLSLAQYHMELRIVHASDLLRNTTLPVTAVGQQVGFEEAAYFCRIFKRKTGYSPGDYRAMSQDSLLENE